MEKPLKTIIAEYVERNDTAGLADFFQAYLYDIQVEQREQVLAFLNSDEMKIDETIFYDKDVDITEIPEDLLAEIRGVKKGMEAAKNIIRSCLN